MLAISEAFLARLISGVSGPTSMPFPLISVSKSFLYCLCEDRIYTLYSQHPEIFFHKTLKFRIQSQSKLSRVTILETLGKLLSGKAHNKLQEENF